MWIARSSKDHALFSSVLTSKRSVWSSLSFLTCSTFSLVLLQSHCIIKSQTVTSICQSTPVDTNLLMSSSMVLLSPLMIPWRKELMELSTGVPVVAYNSTKDMTNYADMHMPDQWGFRNSRWYLSRKCDFDIKTNVTHVVTRKWSLQFACHVPSTKKGGPNFTLK